MPEFPDEGNGEMICGYGTGYLLKQVSALRKEIPGVIAGGDVEHIHRMRVATRRLRSALPLFSLCFSDKKIRRWRRGLRETARALGGARDTDVQIAFLHEYVLDLKSGRPAGNRAMLPAVILPHPYPVPYRRDWYNPSIAFRRLMKSARSFISRAEVYLNHILHRNDSAGSTGPGEQENLLPGTECVLTRKSQERTRLQNGIVKAIRRLEKSGLLGEIEKDLRRHERREERPMRDSGEIFATAFVSVSARIDALLDIGESLADPGKIREHHLMRIAVKRLRYTLEVWRDLFEGELGAEIETLKGLQDLLGDLHDCDVWIGYLPGFLGDEGERCTDFFGNDDHFRTLVPGIEALRREREDRRRQLHGVALTFWKDLAFRNFWEGLREKLILPLSGSREGALRIGLLANIRGDHAALGAVLTDGRSRGVGLFLNAGDIMGSPGASGEIVGVLRREGVVSVRGDRDREILDGIPPEGGDTRWGNLRQRQSKITGRFVRALPASLRLALAGRRIFLTHGSPEFLAEPLDGDTPVERLCQVAREADAEIVVTGGSGLPSLRSACDVLFVNPGSVGRPEEPATPPCYAILEIAPDGTVTVSHHELGSGSVLSVRGAPLNPTISPAGVPEFRTGNRERAGE